MASYTYSNTTDFINASNIIVSELQEIILASGISSANILYSIESGDNINIYFDGALSSPDQSILLDIVNAYTTGTSSEEVITDIGAYNLSNKNLLTDTNYFVEPLDYTKRIGFSAIDNTTNTTLILYSQTTADRTIIFPDINDTVATLTASQILTNKTLNNVEISGTGNSTASLCSTYISPSSTVLSSTNNYFFTYLARPSTTGATTGSAYTLYIEGDPLGTITKPYSLYISSGKTYIGGSLQIPTGAQNGYILTSDINGNVSWSAPSSSTFADGTVLLPSITFTNDTDTGFYRVGSNQIGITLGGTNYVTFKTTGVDFTTGQTLNVGTSGTTSPLNVYGLISGSNGLTISSGISSLRALTCTTLNASGLITAGAGVSSTTITASGLITGSNGLTISAGTSSLQALTCTTLNASGLISGTLGLTITGANSALTTLSTSGLITANAGITVTTGQTLNVGTSGTTSSLNVFGQTDFLGVGSSTFSSANVYIAPSSTSITGANDYYFTYLSQPATSGATTGSAYTLYIDNEPSGTITRPYAFYVNAGKTYLGGALQIPTGASNGSVLTSDASGNSSWNTPGVAYDNATVSSTITTTSNTSVNISGMTLTPPAGTYYFVFTGVGSVNNNSRGFNVQFAKNGTLVSGSRITILTTTAQSIVTTSFVITVNGTDTLTAQWFISGGAGTLTLFTQRSLTALKLSP